MPIKNLQTRLNYNGGSRQRDRMELDKLRSLKKALIYSYQSATVINEEGQEFRCLINRNKLTMDLDEKVLSIPFEDICLNKDMVGKTSEGIVETKIKEGSLIEWKENNSHWLVYLQRLEETAYFRANMRRCRYEIKLEDGTKCWAATRGPIEQNALWAQAGGNYYNKLNYTSALLVPKNEKTEKHFSRFKKVFLNNKPWEIQAVDTISTPGIIEVFLKEAFSNTPETDIDKAVEESFDIYVADDREDVYIFGEPLIYPYDIKSYILKNTDDDIYTWKILSPSRQNLVKMSIIDKKSVRIEVLTGRSGSFTLGCFREDGSAIALLDIEIGSL